MTQEEKEFFTRLENKIDKLQLAVDQLTRQFYDLRAQQDAYRLRFVTGPVVARFNGDTVEFSRTNNAKYSSIEPPDTIK